MSDTLDLEKLTLEEAETLLKNGTSAQGLLSIVVKMSTTSYSSVTGKFEPSLELIAKQSKLAQLCITKGANFKGAFENIYIPASFIENNLPLIASHYDPTKILNYISGNTYGLNNPLNLITKLMNEYKADAGEVSYISSELDSSSIDLLLSKGMKGDALLNTAFNVNNNQEKQKVLFELAFKHGASSSYFKNQNISVENCNEDIVKLLMDNYKVSPQDLLSTVVRARIDQYNQTTQQSEPSPELIARQTALTYFLIENGAALKNVTMFSNDFVKNHLQLIIESNAKLKAEHLDWSSFTIEEVETLLKHKISPKDLFKGVLSNAESFSAAIGNVPISEELIIKFKNIIELIKLNNVDTNKVFGEYFKTQKSGLINSDIFKYLLENKLIDATHALEYAIRRGSIDLANLAFNYQPNINDKSQSSNLTLLDKALMTGNLDIIDWLLDKGVERNANYKEYFNAINKASFDDACKIVERLPGIYNQVKIDEYLSANGVSIMMIKHSMDYYNLIVEYLAAMQGKTTSLSELEQQILTPDTTIAVDYVGGIPKNIYGYTPLHLAIIADKYDLAKKMIEAGYELYTQNKNGVTPLECVAFKNDSSNDGSETNTLKQLKQFIAKKIDNIDIVFDGGKSLADSFIEGPELASILLSRTQDPLFHFYKPGSTSSNLDPEKIHIAIGHEEHLDNSNMSKIARLIMKANKDVEFHFVSYKALKEGGDNFIKQFDAFINEGTMDVSYPESTEFTTNNYSFSTPTEQLYQLILQKTDELKIPYLGICGSAHALSLYHQGAVAPIKGYGNNQHDIEFIKGTVPYFLSLSSEQQEQALKKGTFPTVKFKGETRSNHSIVKGKLGKDMVLGAVSEDQAPMAFVDKSGIRVATQYHPEYHYSLPSATHEKAWLDNFVALARLHHNHKVYGTVSPSEYLQFVEHQLAQFTSDDTTSSVETMGDMQEISY